MLDQVTSVHTLSRPAAARRGFTLVEALITMAVMAVLVAIAAPAMSEFIMRKRVEGAADELLADFRMARSMQSRDNQYTAIRFSRTSSETCYVVFHTAPGLTCNCTSTPVCDTEATGSAVELKSVHLPASAKITILPSGSSASYLLLHHTTGLPVGGTALSIDVSAPSGGTVRFWTSATGRVQLCSVSGHLSAYPACPQ